MANITLLGASYTDVPAVTLPQTGGGTVTFYENGGGGGTLKPFVIRPDAEVIQTHTLDSLYVADMGNTLPSYSTSAKTIVPMVQLSTIAMDITNYNYYVTQRGLAIPIYNTDTIVAGRCEYVASAMSCEVVVVPAYEARSLNGASAYTGNLLAVFAPTTCIREVYWRSATNISCASSTYGTYIEGQAPGLSSTSSTTLIIRSPRMSIRGSSTYFSSSAWSSMTDIREQYIVQVWRAPKANYDGWEVRSNIRSIFEDVRNGGTLT